MAANSDQFSVSATAMSLPLSALVEAYRIVDLQQLRLIAASLA